MFRRDAFLGVGGFFEPFFLNEVEVELAARLLAAGGDVRYLPTAEFQHLRPPNPYADHSFRLRLRVRNRLYY